ncbi:DoxX family protein [Caballeronia ptereochthonis]|uniref:DoxX family protein n=1 Tax=Caballeronia ptereochthonis TaxID=1777144 RepID=A0A158CDK2_9BURK|nr:DoxX family protein [Caballeronia ptereochthonis]SAK80392.1 DoxX family protein [Caballeronia ptereochthonis]
MRYLSLEQQKDPLLLVARVLLMILFVLFGWQKLIGFSGTVSYMTSVGAPAPTFSAIIAVVMELVVGIAIVLGLFTRPLALLLALYTLGTALIGHHYWTMEGAARYANTINFYKNISIMGGLILLSITGPGKYSFDRR